MGKDQRCVDLGRERAGQPHRTPGLARRIDSADDGPDPRGMPFRGHQDERGSLIVTTNLPFGEWTKVFPDPRLAKAVVDRLTHRAHIIDTGTESWRFRHGLTRKTKPGRPPTS